MREKVAVVGAGSWGTAIANLLGEKEYDVRLWIRETEVFQEIKETSENKTFLPGIKLSKNLKPCLELGEALDGVSVIVIGAPSQFVRPVVKSLIPYVKENQIILNIAKGIEIDSLKRMSEIVEEILPGNRCAVLSGPSHAEEVGRGVPTAIVASSKSKEAAEFIQDIFMTKNFRVYTNADIVGVELGGALKNIIALGAGIVDGLEYGDNSKAALMTRGMVEMARLGSALGANKGTFGGLSGMGDLIVTCTSMHSRNRRAGIEIGKGRTLKEIVGETKMIIEGVANTQSAWQLAKKLGVEMPITNEIHKVLYEEANVRESVYALMTRSKAHEAEDITEMANMPWGK